MGKRGHTEEEILRAHSVNADQVPRWHRTLEHSASINMTLR
jgi:hypothetical protein